MGQQRGPQQRTDRTATAIVIGASMGGLAAARVLSDHAALVTVFERDTIEQDAGIATRRGVPQGRHAHALLASGDELMQRWYPGITGQLLAAGAMQLDAGEAYWWQAGAPKVQTPLGESATFASRPLLEQTVRANLVRRPNVELRAGTSVDDLAIEGGRVVGVIADGQRVDADLVVDCTGRNTRLLQRLVDAGFPEPETSHVNIDMSYTTRVLPRHVDDVPGRFVIIAPTPPHEPRFGVMLPIEGDRWILTMGGFHGDRCPADPEGFRAFARSLPSPVIADLLDRIDLDDDAATFKMASNQWRHIEKLKQTPGGFLMLGDAICSFNPIYGQGMSSAAKQAEALESVLGTTDIRSAQLAPSFYARARQVVMNPWQIAAGSDFLHPATTGPKPKGTDAINRYIGKVQLATHTSPKVLGALMKVQNLQAAPPTLMAPPMMVRVLLAARRSPARAKRSATAASATGQNVGSQTISAQMMRRSA